MRMTFHILFLMLVVVFCVPAQAQQSATRDPQAIVILTRMAAVTGWNRLHAPADVVATGTMTRYRGEQQDTLGITLKAKSAGQIRTEVQEAGSSRITIVNGGRGMVITSEGIRRIPSHGASPQSFILPFLTDLASSETEAVSVSYLGTEAVRGEPAHRIEIIREPPADYPWRELRRKAIRLTVWVSAASALPIQLQYNHFASDNPTATYPATRYFSDYCQVGRLLVPFRQEESMDGELRFVIQFARVDFNVGLAESDFDTSAAPN